MKNGFLKRKSKGEQVCRLIAYVNRRHWWHVVPVAPDAYRKRGKFLASTFEEAEFYGRPLNEPQRVVISRPLVGDEKRIARILRIPPQREGMSYKQIVTHDAKWRNAALRHGYDSILLMAPIAIAKFMRTGEIPRSMELNILRVV